MSEEILFKLTDEEYELMHELGLYYLSDKRKILKLYLENLVLRTRLQVYRELGLIIEIPDPKDPIPFELTPKAMAELRDSVEPCDRPLYSEPVLQDIDSTASDQTIEREAASLATGEVQL
jgi:hypothetical protein